MLLQQALVTYPTHGTTLLASCHHAFENLPLPPENILLTVHSSHSSTASITPLALHHRTPLTTCHHNMEAQFSHVLRGSTPCLCHGALSDPRVHTLFMLAVQGNTRQYKAVHGQYKTVQRPWTHLAPARTPHRLSAPFRVFCLLLDAAFAWSSVSLRLSWRSCIALSAAAAAPSRLGMVPWYE